MNIVLSAIDRVAFSIGSVSVRWYGLLITIGMIVALLIVCGNMKRIGLKPEDGVEMFLWVVPIGVVFARLLYVAVRPEEYFYQWTSFDDFVNMIAVWEGGLTIIGGIFGGILGMAIFAARHKKSVNFGQCVDAVIVAVLLAQTTGRVGNFINQEAFGIAITNPALQHFPFAVWIDDPSGVSSEFVAEVWSYINGNGGGYWFAATFFYELCWNVLGAVIFFFVWRRNNKVPGLLFFCYLGWECLIRALLEYLRVDAVAQTQVLCFVALPIVIVLGVLYTLYRLSKVSYNKVLFATEAGITDSIKLTRFDVANFAFVGKICAPDTGFAKFVASRYAAGMKKGNEQANYVVYQRVANK